MTTENIFKNMANSIKITWKEKLTLKLLPTKLIVEEDETKRYCLWYKRYKGKTYVKKDALIIKGAHKVKANDPKM